MKYKNIIAIAFVLNLIGSYSFALDLPLTAPLVSCQSESFWWTVQEGPTSETSGDEEPVQWFYVKNDGKLQLSYWGGVDVKFEDDGNGGLVMEFDELIITISKEQADKTAPEATIRFDIGEFKGKPETGHCIGRIK